MYTLKNEYVTVSMKESGAELTSIAYNGKEYLWNADAKYWGRTAPVLFPFVGAVNGNVYRYDGTEYAMGQHGFARDMDFEVVDQKDTEITFKLESSEETLKKYPFQFALFITYVLDGKNIKVIWKVENKDDKEMHFSIGGHPAFMCPINGEGKQTDYSMELKKDGQLVKEIQVGVLAGGLLSEETITLKTDKETMPITSDMFDRDALIIENKQLDEVSLVNAKGEKYLTVSFDTPLLGIWSPTGKNAPFVCIEPWYGRCDRTSFEGELADREYGRKLSAGETFEGGFEIRL